MCGLACFLEDGYTVVPDALPAEAVAQALADWDAIARAHAEGAAVLAGETGPAYGARNLLDLWPAVVELIRAKPIRDALAAVLGPDAGVVRGLYFDKPPGRSWALPWHKDLSLAVREHRASPLYTKPTVKAGVPHVIAPHAVLDRMLTVRIHLDDMTPANGPLRAALAAMCATEGAELFIPPLSLCTDNAAMAALAVEKWRRGEFAPPDLDAEPNFI